LALSLVCLSVPLAACSGAPPSGGEPQSGVHADPSSTDKPADPSNPSVPATPSNPTTPSACGATVAAYCATTKCLATWSDADAVCMNAIPMGPTTRWAPSCGAFFGLEQADGTSYFDAKTNALVAVVDANGKCVAGPSDFAAPAPESCTFTVCGPMNCGGAPDAGR
jgi:hypothetical protein